MWAKNWSKIPINKKNKTYQKKLLIRYPKTLTAVNEVAMFLTGPLCLQETLFFQRLIHRYKMMIRSCFHSAIIRSSSFPFTPHFQKFMKVKEETPPGHNYYWTTEGVNLQAKGNKVAELSTKNSKKLFPLLSNFQKIVTLKHLFIDCIPLLSELQYRRLLFASKNNLQHLAFKGPLVGFQSQDLLQFINLLLEFPNLKSLRFSAECPEDFDVNNFPFSILNKRQINFDIRLSHFAETLLSDQTLACFSNLEYLAINTIKSFTIIWNTPMQHRAQEGLSRLLFLNVAPQENFDSRRLLETCLNISVLDLMLDGDSASLDFTNLRHMTSLKSLLLRLYRWSPSYQSLFDNLTLQAQSFKTLKSLALRLDLSEWDADLNPFFEACGETVQELDFSVLNCNGFEAYLDLFYGFFGKIKRLTSFHLEYFRRYQLRSKETQKGVLYLSKRLLNLIQEQTHMEKLTIKLDFRISFDLNTDKILLKLPPSVKNFSLKLDKDLENLEIDQLWSQNSNLQELKISTNFSDSSLSRLVKNCLKLRELETITLDYVETTSEVFEVLPLELPKLKRLILAEEEYVVRMGRWSESDEDVY